MIALKAERYMSNVQTLNAVSSAQMGQFVTIFNGLKMLSQNFGATEHCVRLTKLLGALIVRFALLEVILLSVMIVAKRFAGNATR